MRWKYEVHRVSGRWVGLGEMRYSHVAHELVYTALSRAQMLGRAQSAKEVLSMCVRGLEDEIPAAREPRARGWWVLTS